MSVIGLAERFRYVRLVSAESGVISVIPFQLRFSSVRFESMRSASLQSEVLALFNSISTVYIASSERLSLCLHHSAKLLRLIGWFVWGSDMINSDFSLVKFQAGRGLNPCRPVWQ